MRITPLAAAFAAACFLAGTAVANPNWRAEPTYTTVNLTAGFMPDPWRQSLQAGGGDAVSAKLGANCTGHIHNAAPDVDLNYTAGSGTLYIRVASSADTTLVVYDPAGNWYCSDDAVGLDPVVTFSSPRTGNYNIWVGTHGGSLQSAELQITELNPSGSHSTSSSRPNWAATPVYETVNLTAGFWPDPWTRSLSAGGSHDVGASVGGACAGFINATAPDFDLNYTAGNATLYFHASSAADTTLAVLDPAGHWYCNDDALGLDPVVSINGPRTGNYNIWVGVHGSSRLEAAELRITEISPR